MPSVLLTVSVGLTCSVTVVSSYVVVASGASVQEDSAAEVLASEEESAVSFLHPLSGMASDSPANTTASPFFQFIILRSFSNRIFLLYNKRSRIASSSVSFFEKTGKKGRVRVVKFLGNLDDAHV